MTKILLVEDNEMNRDMLGRRLQRRGYEVLIAVDGAEGVAKAQADPPDLILMDMSLPVMDGWEATRRLKAAPETQAIPIIALTAHAMSGDREQAIEAGSDDYDTKPIELDRLLGKIEALLNQGGRGCPMTTNDMPEPDRAAKAGREGSAAIPGPHSASHLRHELRTPINHIIGYSELLLEEARDSQLEPFYRRPPEDPHSGEDPTRDAERPLRFPNANRRLSFTCPATGGRSILASR